MPNQRSPRTRFQRRLAWSSAAFLGLFGGAFGQTTTRVSTSPVNTQGNSHSFWGAVSDDGNFVAFQSAASNLVLSDVNGHLPDIFFKDRGTSNTWLASVTSAGVQGNSGSIAPNLSADGRYVAFESLASNLVVGDTNNAWDVFVHDRLAGTTVRVSVGAGGVQGDADSRRASISADGRFVAFASEATNLVAGDTNGVSDVYLRDLLAGTTTRVSLSTGGAQGDGASLWASVSGDGRYVAFQSASTDLVAGDTNGAEDVFRKDMLTGTLLRVSVGTGGIQGNGPSVSPSISADGAFVAFQSSATNLVAGDTNAVEDVFVRDLALSQTARASVGPGGVQANNQSLLQGNRALSADGRFVAFDSFASNLVASDTNAGSDCFVRDRWTGLTERVSVTTAGAQAGGGSRSPTISGNGRYVVFESSASTLVVGDTNLVYDVFLRDRGALDPTTAYCFGDGSGAPCTCGNVGASDAGCANSAGLGARATAGGSASLALDSLVVIGAGLPATQPALLFAGLNAVNGGLGVPFGDGLRCAGGGLQRLGIRTASATGTALWGPGLLSGLGASSGDTRYLQLWYRDPVGPCGSGFNLSNGLSLTLVP